MGQCYGRVLSRSRWWGRRGRRQFRHKAFEFAPKRSWKYKDTNLLGQADDYGNEGALDNSPPIGAQSQPVTMVAQEDSEEELDTGEIRRSGLLAFDEQTSDYENEREEEEEGGFQTTPIHAPGSAHYQAIQEEEGERRERTASSASQQIGRFEVLVIDEPTSTSGSAGETSKLIDHTHSTPQLELQAAA